VDYIIIVEVVDCFQDLFDRLRGILFRKLAIFADSIKELSACGQFSYDIVFVLLILVVSIFVLGQVTLTLDSNQSWNLTIWGCFILWSISNSSYTIRSLPLTFFLSMILMATLPSSQSASRTIPYVPAPRVLPNLYLPLKVWC
jgi:hypothetical protein